MSQWPRVPLEAIATDKTALVVRKRRVGDCSSKQRRTEKQVVKTNVCTSVIMLELEKEAEKDDGIQRSNQAWDSHYTREIAPANARVLHSLAN